MCLFHRRSCRHGSTTEFHTTHALLPVLPGLVFVSINTFMMHSSESLGSLRSDCASAPHRIAAAPPFDAPAPPGSDQDHHAEVYLHLKMSPLNLGVVSLEGHIAICCLLKHVHAVTSRSTGWPWLSSGPPALWTPSPKLSCLSA